METNHIMYPVLSDGGTTVEPGSSTDKTGKVASSTDTPRKMTIARGLTRIKTIQGQIVTAVDTIQKYGAWISTRLVPISTQDSISANHAEVKKIVQAAYQQIKDLASEETRIRLAIYKANHATVITVADKQFTIAEALIFKAYTKMHTDQVIRAFSTACINEENKAERFNKDLNLKDVAPESVDKFRAQVVHMLPFDSITKAKEYSQVFAAEVNGVLNEVNATTEIFID